METPGFSGNSFAILSPSRSARRARVRTTVDSGGSGGSAAGGFPNGGGGLMTFSTGGGGGENGGGENGGGENGGGALTTFSAGKGAGGAGGAWPRGRRSRRSGSGEGGVRRLEILFGPECVEERGLHLQDGLEILALLGEVLLAGREALLVGAVGELAELAAEFDLFLVERRGLDGLLDLAPEGLKPPVLAARLLLEGPRLLLERRPPRLVVLSDPLVDGRRHFFRAHFHALEALREEQLLFLDPHEVGDGGQIDPAQLFTHARETLE